MKRVSVQEVVYYEVRGKKKRKPSSTEPLVLQRIIVCDEVDKAEQLKVTMRDAAVVPSLWCLDCISNFSLLDPQANNYQNETRVSSS